MVWTVTMLGSCKRHEALTRLALVYEGCDSTCKCAVVKQFLRCCHLTGVL